MARRNAGVAPTKAVVARMLGLGGEFAEACMLPMLAGWWGLGIDDPRVQERWLQICSLPEGRKRLEFAEVIDGFLDGYPEEGGPLCDGIDWGSFMTQHGIVHTFGAKSAHLDDRSAPNGLVLPDVQEAGGDGASELWWVLFIGLALPRATILALHAAAGRSRQAAHVGRKHVCGRHVRLSRPRTRARPSHAHAPTPPAPLARPASGSVRARFGRFPFRARSCAPALSGCGECCCRRGFPRTSRGSAWAIWGAGGTTPTPSSCTGSCTSTPSRRCRSTSASR